MTHPSRLRRPPRGVETATARNGGRDAQGLVDHVLFDAEHKVFIAWGFEPGGGREPAPGSLQAHLDDMVVWTAAGMPLPASGERTSKR